MRGTRGNLWRRVSAPSTSRRWCTALVSTGVLVGVLTPAAVAGQSPPASETTGAGTSQTPDESTSTDPVPDPAAVPGLNPNMPDYDETWRNAKQDPLSAAAWGCTPITISGIPHYSSGDVSAHGAWKKGECTNNYAVVDVILQEWYTDGTWRTKAADERTVAAGGGRGRSAVARAACDSNHKTSWRSIVDVDVVDEVDSAEEGIRNADVDCRVS